MITIPDAVSTLFISYFTFLIREKAVSFPLFSNHIVKLLPYKSFCGLKYKQNNFNSSYKIKMKKQFNHQVKYLYGGYFLKYVTVPIVLFKIACICVCV